MQRGTLLAVGTIALIVAAWLFAGPIGQSWRTDQAASAAPVRWSPYVDSTVDQVDQLREQLRSKAGGTSSGVDLVGMAGRASGLVGELKNELAGASPEQRDRALDSVDGLLGDLARLVDAHSRQAPPSSTPGSIGGSAAPGGSTGSRATPETQGNVAPGPASGPLPTATAMPEASVATNPQEMILQMRDMRTRMTSLVNGEPRPEQIVGMLAHLQSMLETMRSQEGELTDRDLSTLAAGLAQTMGDMVGVIEVYVRQEGMPGA